MSKKYLITGIHGMAGSVAADLILKEADTEVWGMQRHTTAKVRENTQHLLNHPRFHLVTGDLSDQSSLLKCIQESDCDYLLNAAAQSFVGLSWKLPIETCDSTGMGVLRLLEAIRQSGKTDIRFAQFCSSEEYGSTTNLSVKSNRGVIPKLTEESVPYPRSPYGCAKAFAHFITRNYRESFGIHASCAIFFNMEGPRRGREFVTKKCTLGAASIALGLSDSITLGPGALDGIRRDWGACEDYMRGVLMMLEQDHGGDYIFATGQSHTIRDLLNIAFGTFSISDWEKYIKYSDEFKRPQELEILCGDASKAKEKLGWKPTISFENLIGSMAKHDFEMLKKDR